jgi:hypothetical protein
MRVTIIIKETFSGPIGFKELWGEVLEVFEWEDFNNLLHELNQVCLYLIVIFYQFTRLDISVPDWCANQIKEDFRRFNVFKKWLKEHNLNFDVSLFTLGNNPAREAKVFHVLFHAGMPLSYEYATQLARSQN